MWLQVCEPWAWIKATYLWNYKWNNNPREKYIHFVKLISIVFYLYGIFTALNCIGLIIFAWIVTIHSVKFDGWTFHFDHNKATEKHCLIKYSHKIERWRKNQTKIFHGFIYLLLKSALKIDQFIIFFLFSIQNQFWRQLIKTM